MHVRANRRGYGRVAERRTTSARSYVPLVLLAGPGPRVAREGTVGRGRESAWALLPLLLLIVSLLLLLLGLASRLIATVAMWRARRLRACWGNLYIYLRGKVGGGRERDKLDFGLEALLFFGCALDGAGVLCV